MPFTMRQWGDVRGRASPHLVAPTLCESQARASLRARKAGNDEGVGGPLQELGEGGGPGTNNEMGPVIICGFNVGKIGSLELMED